MDFISFITINKVYWMYHFEMSGKMSARLFAKIIRLNYEIYEINLLIFIEKIEEIEPICSFRFMGLYSIVGLIRST